MAETVSVPFDEFWQQMGGRGIDIGKFASLEESYEHLCRDRLKIQVDPSQIEQMAQYHYEYVTQALVPDPEVLEALRSLKDNGLKLGLITNCGPEVPLLWQSCPLSSLFDVSAFSCEIGVKKPDPKIYITTCTKLGVDAGACIYVGDGSNDELRGAAQIGMYPILKRIDLEDVYDPDRNDVKNWNGPEVEEISEILGIIDAA